MTDPNDSTDQRNADRPVREIVTRLEERADHDSVTLRDLLQAGGAASFIPALIVPALLVVSPLSGIPFFSTFCGITIAFIAAQMLFKRQHLHLPDLLTRQTVPGEKLRAGLLKMHHIADFLDRRTHEGRLHQLVGNGGRILPQLLCVIAGAMMPLLEIVPFSSSIIGAAVLSFAVALLTQDGLFVLIGMVIMATLATVLSLVVGGAF
ncbi:exopolysaccharide biosynthesis protein [Seohaeicola saemankumensis]|uniref:exopolysaccharide biosynthesis protein n=1 Tax=Seohaeicola saemankumensis TaxID=481181 RepID=UPI001E2A915D|nr:exopolysaccharide biosynthesis protein [Seohaeicola saemankumensis]MCD1627382.1 exopolysaccharide biosynthesis protein [Seohaeicola saemankumensis]